MCPLVRLSAGDWLPSDLASHPSVRGRLFGCLITEGLSVREVLLAGRVCTQMFGPGDLLGADDLTGASLPLEIRYEAPEGVSVALLDDRFLIATRRWPRLSGRLMDLTSAQLERTSVHQAISQLPRVEDRLLALFWHLADRWAQVSADGVTINVPLTHEALGRLVGAKRPTVSLGLTWLAGEGILVRREDGTWLLAPDSLSRLRSSDAGPRPTVPRRPRPAAPVPALVSEAFDRDALFARVAALRERIRADRERTDAAVAHNRRVRARLAELRGMNQRRAMRETARA